MLSDHPLPDVLSAPDYLNLSPEDQQHVVVEWHRQKIAELRGKYGDEFKPDMLLNESAKLLSTDAGRYEAPSLSELGETAAKPITALTTGAKRLVSSGLKAGQGLGDRLMLPQELREARPQAPVDVATGQIDANVQELTRGLQSDKRVIDMIKAGEWEQAGAQAVFDGAQNMPQVMATTAMALIPSVGPGLAVGTMGAQVGGESLYETRTDPGMTQGEKDAEAVIDSTAEAAFEAVAGVIPAIRANQAGKESFKRGMRSALGKAAKVLREEVAGETATTLVQEGSGYLTGAPVGDIPEAVARTAISTPFATLPGAGAAGVGHYAAAERQARQQPPDTRTTEGVLDEAQTRRLSAQQETAAKRQSTKQTAVDRELERIPAERRNEAMAAKEQDAETAQREAMALEAERANRIQQMDVPEQPLPRTEMRPVTDRPLPQEPPLPQMRMPAKYTPKPILPTPPAPSPESPVTQKQFTTALRQIADAMEGKAPVPAAPDTTLPENAPPPPDVRAAEPSTSPSAKMAVGARVSGPLGNGTIRSVFDGATGKSAKVAYDIDGQGVVRNTPIKKLQDATPTPPAPAASPRVVAPPAEGAGATEKQTTPPPPKRTLPASVLPGGQTGTRAKPKRNPYADQTDDIVRQRANEGVPDAISENERRIQERKAKTPEPVITGTEGEKTVSTPLPPKVEKTITNKQAKPLLMAELKAAHDAAKPAAEASDEARGISLNISRQTNAQAREQTRQDMLNEAKRVYGTITVDVPGDGRFTIGNSKEHIADFMKRVQNKLPTSTQASQPKQPGLPKATPEELNVLRKEGELAEAQMRAEGKEVPPAPVTAAVDRAVKKLEEVKTARRKTNRGKLHDITSALPQAVLDGAIDIAITSLKAGRPLAQAIDAAVQYVKSKRGELFSRDDERELLRALQDVAREAGYVEQEPRADLTPSGAEGATTKPRKLINRTEEAENIEPRDYEQEKTGDLLRSTMDQLAADPELAGRMEDEFFSAAPDSVDDAVKGVALMQHYRDRGDREGVARVADRLDVYARKMGRFIQTLSFWSKVHSGVKWDKAAREFLELHGVKLSEKEEAALQAEMESISQIDDPAERQQALQDMVDWVAEKAGLSKWDWFDAYRYTNMLMSPITTARNVWSGVFNAGVLRPLMLAGKLDGSTMPYLRGMAKALPQAWESAAKAFKGMSDQPSMFIDRPNETAFEMARRRIKPKGAIKGKAYSALTFVERFLEAQDTFLTEAIKLGELTRLAETGEISKMIAADPSISPERAIEMLDRRTEKLAKTLMFRENVGSAVKDKDEAWAVQLVDRVAMGMDAARALKNKKGVANKIAGRAAGMVVPFLRTPASIVNSGVRSTPLGYVGGKRSADTAGLANVGSTVMAGSVLMAMSGMLTADVPKDEQERERFYASGRIPWAVYLPGLGRWVPMAYLGPLMVPMGVAAISVDRFGNNPQLAGSGAGKRALSAMLAAADLTTSQMPLKGVGEALSILTEKDTRQLEKFLAYTSGQLVPGQAGMRFIGNITDPVYRKAKNGWEQIARDIPWMRTNLRPYEVPPLKAGGKPTEASRTASAQFAPYRMGVEDKRYDKPLKDRQDTIRMRRVNDAKIEDLAADGNVSELRKFINRQDNDESGRLRARLKDKAPEVYKKVGGSKRLHGPRGSVLPRNVLP